MLTRNVFGSGVFCTAGLILCACGGGSGAPNASGVTGMPGSSTPMTQQSQPQQLDTQQLLSMAEVRSETADPDRVGNGALTVADTDDEASDPMPVG